MKKLAVILTLVLVITLLSSVLCEPAHAVLLEDGLPTDLYAVSIDNHNIYQINPLTGSVTTVSTTTMFPSIGAAFDGTFLYYWNADNVTQRGIGRWDPLTGTHTFIKTTAVSNPDVSEENAATSNDGALWILDRTNSYDPTIPGFLGDNTGNLYRIDKNTGNRIFDSTLPDVGGSAVGDIAWGPDDKLYISTNNTFWGYDTVDNYIWDPSTSSLSKMGGDYHAGLVWLGDKLYGSKTLSGNTGAVFELDPTDFSDILQVAMMPDGVTIGDLTTTIPEPITIALLGLGGLALLRKPRV